MTHKKIGNPFFAVKRDYFRELVSFDHFISNLFKAHHRDIPN